MSPNAQSLKSYVNVDFLFFVYISFLRKELGEMSVFYLYIYQNNVSAAVCLIH